VRRSGIAHAHADSMSTFTYRDLDVWKQGMNLVEAAYKATESFPKSELYGLTSQLRRAAISIPANIAEGHSRRTTKAYLNQISIAIGSQAELETDLELSRRLGYLKLQESAELIAMAQSVGRLLYGLHRALARKVLEADL
jgi:four helix bundle protein